MSGIIIGSLFGIRRRIERKFKDADATSEEKAATFEKLGIDRTELALFRRLLENGVIMKTEDERYYLSCKDKKHC